MKHLYSLITVILAFVGSACGAGSPMASQSQTAAAQTRSARHATPGGTNAGQRIYYAESVRVGFHPPWPTELSVHSKVKISYWYSPAGQFSSILPLREAQGEVIDFGMNFDSTIWVNGRPENRVSVILATANGSLEVAKPRIHEIYLLDAAE